MTNKPPDSSDTDINWSSQEVAERRNRGRARRGEIQGPATQMMLDLAEVRTGSRVLDVAAVTGDQTLMAGQRVGPSGYVLAIDVSASMLKLAADAAREAGLMNVESRVMDAQNIDLLVRCSDMPVGTVSVLQSGERAAIDASSGSVGG